MTDRPTGISAAITSDASKDGHAAAHDRYPHAFTPIRIGPVEVRNRVFMPAHGIPLIVGGPRGTKVPSDDYAHYFAERAAGGVGLLFHSMISGAGAFNSPLQEESIPSFRAVAEAVHRHGAKIFAHIWPQPGGAWEPLSPFRPVMGASPFPRFERYDSRHGLASAVMPRLIDQFARCAANLAAAGYDGFEVHTSHGLMLEQFLSPYFNHRTDAYGGDFEGRLRTLTEILRVVRAAMGPDRAVGVRMTCDEKLPGGITQADARDVLTALMDRGLIDFAGLDAAVGPQRDAIRPAFIPPMHERPYIEGVGPVIKGRIANLAGIGRVTTMAQVEQLLAEGVADMIGLARGLIAEPALVKNALEGREDRSRACVAGNACSANRALFGGWSCVINPVAGKERLWGQAVGRTPARPGNVVVVGGGPAGLEAARVAALQGHRVVLMERAAALGGQLLDWGKLPDREHMLGTVDWYRGRLSELGVEARLARQADVTAILAEQPDAVIVASGGQYCPDGASGFQPFAIPGWRAEFVLTPERVLNGVRPQGRVLVLDEEGLHTGVGIAELLARDGAQVELVTSQAQIAVNLVATTEAEIIIGRLKRLGVRLTTEAYVREIVGDEAVVYDIHTEQEERRQVDAVVLATRRRSVGGLEAELAGKVAQVFLIGDALSPRSLGEATYEGHRFARLIGAEGAARSTDEALLEDPSASVFPGPASRLLSAVSP
jgi:2,4-dienoyl-CoA reductase-like NADH-dependent reductase (Old Yellow Enzyme family)